jgi:hypothetical protein
VSDVDRLARECAALLAQGRELALAIGPDRFAACGPAGSASAGAHLRHVIEHCAALLGGIASRRVDYDGRPRDARLERDVAAAVERIDSLRRALVERVAASPDLALAVRSDEPELPAGAGFLRSSLARELRAVASHAVHHYAVIALALRVAGVEVDPSFGVAPSTLAHRVREAAQSSAGSTIVSGRTQAS